MNLTESKNLYFKIFQYIKTTTKKLKKHTKHFILLIFFHYIYLKQTLTK